MADHENKLPLASSHRLPTVSASQALHNIKSRGFRAISTGLTELDKHLFPYGLPGSIIQGGLVRGKVTEVYGPPGVGKTAFGIQAAVNALCTGNRVCWIDAAAPLVAHRFNEFLVAASSKEPLKFGQSSSSPPELSLDELQSHFHHFSCPTLAHLLALFVHPPSSFPPPNTGLIVIDSLSTLFDNAYPRNADDRPARNKSEQSRWAAGRKFTVMNELVSRLGRIASMHDIAILLTCQTITRIRGSSRALLVPAISGAEWDSGISTRLVLFTDWVPGQGKWSNSNTGRLRKARFAGVVKVNGVSIAEEGSVGNVVPFTIEGTGLCDLEVDAVNIVTPVVEVQQKSTSRPPKRSFAEIADSEDEEPNSDELYGWVEDDEVAAEGLIVDEAALGEDVSVAEAPT
ncbi:P-loop containing nucleoside triphosphate hydrolase protein [Delitschia confertaspora ATCC 74209]|uniref:P-loop containing nucleoside triphosphate hydrolase protein n=1 Tax=Delitschia confertaspora ATCC 74209 TaxID=1513339 RepID=A0A9P4JGI1_9PLEO|nr:P-loop containing nucleoside triphosphate hydrolase protein [Delitschia confertaspora ATCC 74209]